MINAQSISCNGAQSGTYETSPEFFVLNTQTRQYVTIANCETEFDPNLWVYNAAGEWISSEQCDGDDCAGSVCSSGTREAITMPLDAGTYYIG